MDISDLVCGGQGVASLILGVGEVQTLVKFVKLLTPHPQTFLPLGEGGRSDGVGGGQGPVHNGDEPLLV
jgi:hypothetical protein